MRVQQDEMVIRGMKVEEVDELTYLGGIVKSYGRPHAEINQRIWKPSMPYINSKTK